MKADIPKPDDKVVVIRPRFAAEVDTKLRKNIWRRGELVKLIILILRSIDLGSVPLLEIGSDLGNFATTTVKLPASLHKKLKLAAVKRSISMNTLINSAVWAYKAQDDKDNSKL